MDENPYRSPLATDTPGRPLRLGLVGGVVFALAFVAWVASAVNSILVPRTLGRYLLVTLVLCVSYATWVLLAWIDAHRGLR